MKNRETVPEPTPLPCQERVIILEDESKQLIKVEVQSFEDLRKIFHGKYNVKSIVDSRSQYEEDRATYKKLELNSIHKDFIDKDGDFYPFSWFRIKTEFLRNSEMLEQYKKEK